MREGFVITEGVACAPAVIFKNDPPTVSAARIAPEEIAREKSLYLEALERARVGLAAERENAASPMAREFLDIAILYLTDGTIRERILRRIENELCNAETAVMKCYLDYFRELTEMNDPFAVHSEFEIRNLADTLVLELRRKKVVLPAISEDSVLVCDNITPAQFLNLNTARVKGVLLENGNPQSHMAIVLRGAKIPAIFNVSNATRIITPGTVVLIDAYANRIYLSPLEELIWQARENARKHERRSPNAENPVKPMAARYKTSPDGERMRVLANINSIAEISKLSSLPSAGIGLIRTEFLFMNSDTEPGEEEQYRVYRKIIQMLPHNYEITFRTFDYSADKMPLHMSVSAPFGADGGPYGKKAVRTQLRAILRASARHPVRIMFPMIAEYEEAAELVNLYTDTRSSLISEGHEVGTLKIGIMIETPAGAIMSGALAPLVDFFSIGTNDLTQYTESRSREAASRRCEELTPAVLKLIDITARNARAHRTPVCICGEIVHNLRYLPLFISIGLRDFSVAPFYLSGLLEKIHELEISPDPRLGEKIAGIKTRQEISDLCESLVARRRPAPRIID